MDTQADDDNINDFIIPGDTAAVMMANQSNPAFLPSPPTSDIPTGVFIESPLVVQLSQTETKQELKNPPILPFLYSSNIA